MQSWAGDALSGAAKTQGVRLEREKNTETRMLIGRPTKKGAGIEIFGDYQDLDSLHSTIHFLSEGSILKDEHVEDYILGLAYEVRYAYQGQRASEKIGEGQSFETTYLGFKYLWPHFLVQLALLRHVANKIKTNREHQSNISRLEHLTLEALETLDPKFATKIFRFMPELAALNRKDYLFQFVDFQSFEFVTDLKTKHDRIFDLMNVMTEILPSSEDYKSFKSELRTEAKERSCSLLELNYSYDWSNFKW